VNESRKKLGVQFRSQDGNKVVQFRTNGFTYNWLEPYSDWESLIRNAQASWAEYSRICAKPVPVRIGVRFINHLKFSREEFDLQRFFTFPISVPEGLPTTLSGYLNRVTLEDSRTDLKINLLQSVRTEDDSVVFVLDTDVYALGPVNLDPGWSSLERFREMKNLAFFGTLTEECLRRYE
jgi:uncharacterized protein (TIGR04255 family)